MYVNGAEQQQTVYGHRKDSLLDQVQVGENDAVTYTYDILGRRIAMTVDNVPYQFDYDGDTLLVERGGAELKRSYLYGLGLIWEKDHTQQGAPVAYHYADAHGSTRMLCDADGDPIAYANYDAWGNALDGSDAVGRFGYAGEWGYKSDDGGDLTPNTGGIMQCGVRFYDPDLGRFLQQDPVLGNPLAVASLNRYVYCGNDPINGVDPTGLLTQRQKEILEGVGCIIGGTCFVIGGIVLLFVPEPFLTKLAAVFCILGGAFGIAVGIIILIPSKPPANPGSGGGSGGLPPGGGGGGGSRPPGTPPWGGWPGTGPPVI